jgi:hypothetical protein
MPENEKKVCPECGHVFKGNGYDGIDAHWRSKHENIMPYREAWPMIKDGTYRREGGRGDLSPCASAHYWQVEK